MTPSETKRTVCVGRWFLTALMVFYELIFHLWIGKPFTLAQCMCLVGFAMVPGAVLDLLLSFLPEKANKAVASVLAVLFMALFMTEFFIGDAFHSYMKPSQMIFGAGGIASDYMDIVLQQLLRNWWRLLIVVLPIVLYIGFAKLPKTKSRKLTALVFLAAAAVGLGLGLGGTALLPDGFETLSSRYDFNTCVQVQGLSVSMFQELSGRGEGDAAEELVIEVPETVPTEPAPTEPEVVYEPHVIAGLDFEELAQKGKNTKLCEYIAAQTPAMTNKYTGLLKGKNLILVMAEAFSDRVVDPERTPALYRMATKGIHFTDYYQPLWNGSTTGGEISILSGLVPNMSQGMFGYSAQNPFNTLGAQTARLGYYTRAYHNSGMTFYDRNVTHDSLGYEKFIAMGNGLEEGVKSVWPASDLEMIDFIMPDLIANQPFSAYVITVSGHSLYTMKGNAQARKNIDLVADLPYSEPVKVYLAANMELEHAMASLISQLEEAGIADDTVVVISADHYPYGLDKGSAWGNSSSYIAELKGVDKYDDFIRDSSTLIIWSGCLEDMNLQVDAPTYSLDILPTVSNLFGFEYDSRLTVGRDVLGTEEAIVLWPNHCWKTELGQYDSGTRTFTPVEGAEVPEGYVERISAIVKNKINFSKTVQSERFLGFLRSKLPKE